MTHLKIEQNTSYTENVSLAIIEALYNIAKSGQLDNESDLQGTVRGYCYEDAKLYLEAHYPNFHINVIDNNPYIRFEDPNMVTYLGYIGVGSNGFITKAQAAAATSVATSQTTFDNVDYKTLVTKFNEFKYFTGITQSLGGWDSGSSGALRFSGWTALEEVDISNIVYLGHNGVYAWGDTFAECTNLKTVTASSKLEKIGYRAFRNCSNLEDITGLTGTIMIAGETFSGCSKLKNSNFTNVEFTFDENQNKSNRANAFNGCSQLTSLAFTNITCLPSGTCRGCTNLSSITGHSNVTEFASYALRDCTSLQLTQSDIQSATDIGIETFMDTQLSGNISLQLNSLGRKAFFRTNITSIDLTGSTITNIPENCFTGCEYLRNVILPVSCTTLGKGSFSSLYNPPKRLPLESMQNTEQVTTLEGDVFSYCNAPNLVLSFTNVTSVGNNLFKSNDRAIVNQVYFPKLQETYNSTAYYQNSTYFSASFCRVNANVFYLKDIVNLHVGDFGQCDIKALVINKSTPPAIKNKLDLDDSEYPLTTDTNAWYRWERLFYGSFETTTIPNLRTGTIHIYVPHNCVSNYLTDTQWSQLKFGGTYTYQGQEKDGPFITELDSNNNPVYIHEIGDLNNGVIYANEADWIEDGRKVGLIADKLGLSSADLATFVSTNNLTYYVPSGN